MFKIEDTGDYRRFQEVLQSYRRIQQVLRHITGGSKTGYRQDTMDEDIGGGSQRFCKVTGGSKGFQDRIQKNTRGFRRF